MTKTAIPKSKAKTAYGLLSEIRKIILAEPKRYDQEQVLALGRVALKEYGPFAPACGTVGCVAGWVDVLKGKGRAQGALPRAAQILGINNKCRPNEWETQADELFDGDKAGNRDDYFLGLTPDSIRAHAERGAAHIEEFQKKYAAQLKAKRV